MKPQIQFDSHIRFAVTLHIKRPCNLFILRVIINRIFVDKNILVVVIERRSIHHLNPEKPDVPLNKNDAFQKVQKRRVQEKR